MTTECQEYSFHSDDPEMVTCYIRAQDHIFACNKELLRLKSKTLRIMIDESKVTTSRETLGCESEMYKNCMLLTLPEEYPPMVVKYVLQQFLDPGTNVFPAQNQTKTDTVNARILIYLKLAHWLDVKHTGVLPCDYSFLSGYKEYFHERIAIFTEILKIIATAFEFHNEPLAHQVFEQMIQEIVKNLFCTVGLHLAVPERLQFSVHMSELAKEHFYFNVFDVYVEVKDKEGNVLPRPIFMDSQF